VNSYTEITVTATDKSINANKAKHTIYLKYDPNMLDSLGPIFRQLSGPRSGDTIKDPMVTIIDSIFDLSAVDSVYWSLNGSVRKSLEFLSNNHYRLSDTLKTYHLNRLVVYARDKSNRGNKDSSVISLNYNVPPEINDTILSTGKNAALPCTLRAQSADGDPLAWSMVAPISSSVGNINGSLPIITFTPTSDWIGADSFRVRVTDGKWSDTAKVKITVFSVPVGPKDVKITSQPAIDSIVAGQSISFSVTMNSDINPAPTFQWNHNGTAISGATSLSYAIGTVLPKDTGSYTVTVTNTVGSMTSPAFVLKVLVAPSITVQPNSATKCAGETVSLSVTASGTLPLSYQWKKGGDDATGVSNTGSYSIASVDTLHAGIYTCVISNAYGNITTQPCTLGVNVPISIVEHPASIKKWAGDTVTFSVKAKGSGALTYQWKKGNANIAGATSASYTISGINYFTDNDADYSCVVTNPCGSKTSNAAKLTVDAVKMAAGGDEHSLIVKMDGTLWVCGTNGYGQLGTGDTISRLKPVQIMTSVQSVACGDESSFIIRSDGSLWACGFNEAGGLGLGDQINRLQPTIVIQNVLTVAAGDAHCLIVKNDNTLWACGSNSNGQLGLGDMVDRFDPKYVMNNVSRVAAGGDHSFILKKDGTLYACGYNCYGVLGDGTMQNSPSPIQIKTNVSDIAISNYHSVILMSDKTVLACGENHFGQLGDGTTTERHLPVLVSTLTDVIKIASGSASYSMALKSDGTFWAFGNNSVGNLGDGTTQERHLPIKVNSEVAQFTSSDSHTLIIKTDGSLWGCGQNFYGQLGDGSTMDRHSWIQIKF
jgi:alpha-tubulin suppressor-like RCC1 family protein